MTLLRLVPAMGTHRGMRRKHNEDAIGYEYPSSAEIAQQFGALFIVADGVGGLSAGDQASHLAVDLLRKQYYEGDPTVSTESRLLQSIEQVNKDVFSRHAGKAATTLIAAVLTGDQLVAASVGDSLIFHFWEEQMTQINEIDVFREDPEKDEMLTKAIGYRDMLAVEPIIRTIAPGDTVLLCSDGLSRYVAREQIHQLARMDDPRDAVRRMIEVANKGGGADNVSVIVIQVGSKIEPDALPEHIKKLNIPVAVDSEPIMTLAVPSKPQTQIPLSRPEPIVPETTVFPPPTRYETPKSAPVTVPVEEKAQQSRLFLYLGAVVLILGAMIILGALWQSSSDEMSTATELPDQVISDPMQDDDALIQINDRIKLGQSIVTLVEMGAAQEAFVTEPDQAYLIEEIMEDSEGRLWYRLLDENTEERGWMMASDLSATP